MVRYKLTKNIIAELSGKELAKVKTPYQLLSILETKEFGKVLLLGDETGYIVQLSEKDEAFYHEPVVHPAMALHPNPKRVLIIGGGDGGVLREVLKHPVEEVVMVELDEQVISAIKEHMPFVPQNAFEDSRARVVIQDGRKFVEETDEKFDVVICDLTDPEGPSKMLFTKEFYAKVKERLSPDGVISAQTSSPIFEPPILGRIHTTLKELFSNTIPYTNFVPSFLCVESYVIATDGPKKSIADVLKERNIGLKAYTPEEIQNLLRGNFFTRAVLSKEWKPSTDSDPVDIAQCS